MQLKSLSSALGTGAIALASVLPITLTNAQPSYAGGTSFYCGWSAGYPATLADTPRGTVAIIRWSSEHFSDSGYDSQTRCNIVSNKFQSFYNSGALNFITAGVVRGLPVICATGEYGGACTSSTVLYTLKPGQNAAVVLQRLYESRAGAGTVLYESSKPSNQNANVSSIDVKEFLDNAPVETAASRTTTGKPSVVSPVKTAPETATPAKTPDSGRAW
jgi:hypothetical protein